jgi:hypothetical protein
MPSNRCGRRNTDPEPRRNESPDSSWPDMPHIRELGRSRWGAVAKVRPIFIQSFRPPEPRHPHHTPFANSAHRTRQVALPHLPSGNNSDYALRKPGRTETKKVGYPTCAVTPQRAYA